MKKQTAQGTETGKYNIVLKEASKQPLEKLAKKYKYRWGKGANVQAFLNAIAEGKFQVIPNGEAEPEIYNSRAEIEHLTQAFWTLRDSGQLESAQTIANILLERYEISPALEQHLTSLPANNQFAKITEAIASQTPFTLTYQSASGNPYTFTIRYAEIRTYERHDYLCAWVEEDTGKGESPTLAHNMTLRLDRIKDAVVFPTLGMEWRGAGLDSLIVEMQLTGGWTKGYEPKPDDIGVVNADGGIIVQRKVEFWHFFKREILRYGADCIIQSPDLVHSLIRAEVQKMAENYG